MKYLQVINELLFAVSNGNRKEVLCFAQELCNLAMDGVSITEYERDVAEELYNDLNEELVEEEYNK
jgi:hypothetical protein